MLNLAWDLVFNVDLYVDYSIGFVDAIVAADFVVGLRLERPWQLNHGYLTIDFTTAFVAIFKIILYYQIKKLS